MFLMYATLKANTVYLTTSVVAGTISIIITFSLHFKTIKQIFHKYWAQCGRKHKTVYIIIIITFVIRPPTQPVIQQQQQQGQ